MRVSRWGPWGCLKCLPHHMQCGLNPTPPTRLCLRQLRPILACPINPTLSRDIASTNVQYIHYCLQPSQNTLVSFLIAFRESSKHLPGHDVGQPWPLAPKLRRWKVSDDGPFRPSTSHSRQPIYILPLSRMSLSP